MKGKFVAEKRKCNGHPWSGMASDISTDLSVAAHRNVIVLQVQRRALSLWHRGHAKSTIWLHWLHCEAERSADVFRTCHVVAVKMRPSQAVPANKLIFVYHLECLQQLSCKTKRTKPFLKSKGSELSECGEGLEVRTKL
eukprot:4638315-Amphidinium_carterae.1